MMFGLMTYFGPDVWREFPPAGPVARSGRKPAPARDKVVAAAAAWLDQEGDQPPAEIERFIRDWLDQNGEAQPAKSSVQGWARRARKAFLEIRSKLA